MVFKKIASSVTVFGLFWICIFGEWHTVNAKGDDLPAVTYPEYISVWDDGTTSVDHPYNANTWFDESLNLWEGVFNDGRFRDFTTTDNNRASVELVVSNFVSTNPQYSGAGTSHFDDIVDYVMSHESDFGIYYTTLPRGYDWGNGNQAPWGNLFNYIYIPPEFVDALEDYIIDTYYTVPDSGITINGHHWEKAPCTWQLRGSASRSASAGNGDIYYTTYGSSSVNFARGVVFCSVTNYPASASIGIVINNMYVGSLRTGYYGYNQNGNEAYGVVSCSGFNNSEYASYSAAIADFFGYPIVSNDGTPISNGDVYFRKDGINNSNYLQYSFPALPVQDSKSVSEYYYTTYGDTFEDSETIIDNSVYNYNTTTVYPITYTNDVPLWLVERTVDTPSLEVVTADYSLPSVELEEGDASFWQGLYEALPVSVSVILLGVLLCWLIFTLI